MKNPFLRAKHWQLFLLIWGPLISLMILDYFLEIKMRIYYEAIGYIFPFLLFNLLAWVLSVALGLLKYIPEEIRPNPRWFKIAMTIPFIYVFFFIPEIIGGSGIYDFDSSEGQNLFFTNVIPLHLLTIFSILYCCFFIARNIFLADKKRKFEQFEFIPATMIVYFLPFSIWYLQPKINKVVRSSKYASDNLT